MGSLAKLSMGFGLAAVVGLASLAIGAGDLATRMQTALSEGNYGVGLSAARAANATSLSPQERWLHARLEDRPQRAANLYQSLYDDPAVPAPLKARARFAHAREEFAQGRYRSAGLRLAEIDERSRGTFPEFALYEGMAAQASGENSLARRSFESVKDDSPAYGQAQSQLANLQLKQGNARLAREHALNALKADEKNAGPGALSTLVRAHEALGEGEQSLAARSRLLRDHPHTAEAARMRESAPSIQRQESQVRLAEISAPDRRDDWSLQLGAFRDRSLALRLATKLQRDMGENIPPVRLENGEDSHGPIYRLLSGFWKSRGEADQVRDRLIRRGYDVALIGPESSR